MTILSLVEAATVDPDVTASRLAALEELVRTRTNNSFHRGHSETGVHLSTGATSDKLVLTSSSNKLLPPFLEGDTVHLVDCDFADGLYTVTATSDGGATVVLEGAELRRPGHFPNGRACLVSYPADVVEGVRSILAFDKYQRTAPKGVESKTVGRVTERYSSKLVNTVAGAIPEELLGFLYPHRKLSWS